MTGASLTESPQSPDDSPSPDRGVTITPLRKTVLILALPILSEQLLNSFVGLFDTYLAGDISKAATAAIGLAAYMGWLASMLFMLVGTGTTALIARMTGAGEHADANRIANQSMTLAAITGPAVFVLIYLLAPSFATWQNMPEETAAIVVTYLRIDAAGLTLTAWTLVGAAALRGVADMRTPMLILGMVNVVNVIVSATLVFGLGPFEPMGIHGIVTGTVVARTVGGLITIAVLARGRSGLRLRRHLLTPHWTSIRRIVRIGLPAASDGAIMWTGQFIFLMIIGRLAVGQLGEAYYAAHMIVVRLEAFTYLPAVAWGFATATLVGQALGAGDHARARRVAHEAVLQCGLLILFVSVVFLVGAEWILHQFQSDPQVAEVGATPFRILALFQPLLVMSIIYVHALRGAGDTRFPMVITLIGMVLVRLPLGYLFGIVLHGGLLGAWVGMMGDMTLRAALALIRYSRGRWVHTQV